MLRAVSGQVLEHLSGEESYRVVPVVEGRHCGHGCGVECGRDAAGGDDGQVGLDRALPAALGRWCRPTAIHDPGKIVGDLAIAVALGGDCLADIATVRAEPAVFGQVASDPTGVAAD